MVQACFVGKKPHHTHFIIWELMLIVLLSSSITVPFHRKLSQLSFLQRGQRRSSKKDVLEGPSKKGRKDAFTSNKATKKPKKP